MFDALTKYGVTRRAYDQSVYVLQAWDPRDFTKDAYRTIDDRPYGGGPGMIMMVEPLALAIEAARSRQQLAGVKRSLVVHLTPQGKLLDQDDLMELGSEEGLILLCGRYEGIDERLIEQVVDREYSVGNYVLSGGELPAMMLLDGIIRLLPGVLGDAESATQDSFSDGLLDYPHYTRPEVYDGKCVPAVLLSGNHANIKRWRLMQSLGRTWLRRPDLLKDRGLDSREQLLLDEFKQDMNDKE
ncbi:MAG: tRNA (guanosine(37)-N1)-methyltransferase TrmD [Pseudomonadota bacterium]|nr:tRNA (guanosine(37)-N1)-methyltransferase TrmD [Pseudomonadota bacterium]